MDAAQPSTDAAQSTLEVAELQPSQAAAKPPRKHGRTKHQLITRHEIDGRSNAGRHFTRLVGAVSADLGGDLTAVEVALVEAFAGTVVMTDDLNTRVLLGEKVDVGVFCQLASTMTRVASRLGLRRRPRVVEETMLSDVLRDYDQGEQPEHSEAAE